MQATATADDVASNVVQCEYEQESDGVGAECLLSRFHLHVSVTIVVSVKRMLAIDDAKCAQRVVRQRANRHIFRQEKRTRKKNPNRSSSGSGGNGGGGYGTVNAVEITLFAEFLTFHHTLVLQSGGAYYGRAHA